MKLLGGKWSKGDLIALGGLLVGILALPAVWGQLQSAFEKVYLYVRPPVTPPLVTQTFHAGTSVPISHPEVEVMAGSGFKVIGCGARVNYHGEGNMLTALFPTNHNSCIAASKDHRVGDPATIDAWAVALNDPSDQWDVKIFQATSVQGSHPMATVRVDPGYAMTGGGAQVNYTGPGNILTASYPSSNNTWEARSKDHFDADPATLQVFAIGIRPKNNAPPPVANLICQSSTGLSRPMQTVNIDPLKFTLASGGALDNYSGYGNLLTASYPDTNEWTAYGKDHQEPDPASLTVCVLVFARR